MRDPDRIYTTVDDAVCCGDEATLGNLCGYHAGYEDGEDSLTPALVCLGRFLAGWEPDTGDELWVYRGETTEHLFHGETEPITAPEAAALLDVFTSDYYRSSPARSGEP